MCRCITVIPFPACSMRRDTSRSMHAMSARTAFVNSSCDIATTEQQVTPSHASQCGLAPQRQARLRRTKLFLTLVRAWASVDTMAATACCAAAHRNDGVWVVQCEHNTRGHDQDHKPHCPIPRSTAGVTHPYRRQDIT